jgi:hypothetical protein
MKKKIEMKVQTEEENNDKTKKEGTEEGGGEESVGRRHWSQFNYRSETVSWFINFRF